MEKITENSFFASVTWTTERPETVHLDNGDILPLARTYISRYETENGEYAILKHKGRPSPEDMDQAKKYAKQVIKGERLVAGAVFGIDIGTDVGPEKFNVFLKVEGGDYKEETFSMQASKKNIRKYEHSYFKGIKPNN